MNPLAEKPRHVMVGGFLGARKTTAIWRSRAGAAWSGVENSNRLITNHELY
jgi:hypothetical protein